VTDADPSRYVSPGGELPLSNLGQLELLRAMMERSLPLRIRVRGFSMTPTIRDDDVVTVVPMAGRDLQVGEVVAFVSPQTERLVLHRVVAREGAGWLLRGDNCRDSDGVVTAERILGSIVRVERDGRHVDLGMGLPGAGVARLSRSGALRVIRGSRRLSRRAASSALRTAQGFALYRAVGRRLAPHIDVEEASAADLRALHRLLCAADTDPAPEGLTRPGVTNWVAIRNGKIAGFVQLVDVEDRDCRWAGYWLFSLWVKGRYRGLGVGKALTWRVIAEACARDAPCLSLAVFEDNERAIRLYRQLAFAPVLVDELEPILEAEKLLSGRRRVVMRRDFGVETA
jgi:ribosomal protein S18 acetylase RimI-like enzyme